MKIGQKIKKIRELRDFSQDYMAEKLEISQQAYSEMEKGKIDFPVSRIDIIANILDIKPEDIFAFDEKAMLNNINCTFSGNEKGIAISTNKNILKHLKEQYESRMVDMKE